ncbi:fibronectin type III domain-containing protein [Microbacterium sp. MTN4-26]|uniref:fibronectin type III domain-containing protein n=1 Tax=unclassified Microbacterium TaxID=2609290 RepID=UPI0036F3393D
MASGTARDDYSGRPQYELILSVSTHSTDSGNNRSRYNWRLYARSKSGYGSFAYDSHPWAVNVEGSYYSGSHDLRFTDGGDYSGKEITLGSGTTGWKGHNGDGNLTVTIVADHSTSSVFGSAQTPTVNFSADRIKEAPGKAGTPSVSNIGPVSATFSWGSASRGHANITNYQFQISTNSNFSGATTVNNGTSRSLTRSNLTPGDTYYTRVRAQSSDGSGSWSSTRSFDTLSGGRAFIDGVWKDCRTRMWTGSAWVYVRARRWNGTSWTDVR